MSCRSGYTRYRYTGNQTGAYNFTGLFNYVGGGPAGSGLSAGTTTGVFHADTLTRRPWAADNAVFDDNMLDASYPVINLQWFAEITLDPSTVFRVSNRSFYVQDSNGNNRYYDARVEKPPVINVTVGEWLNPNYEVSDLTLSLNNRDGHYNRYLPHGADFRQWAGAAIVIKVGFSELASNYFTLFEGQVTVKQGLTTTRDTIEIRAYDKLDLDEVPIPPNTFSSDLYPDISDDHAGKPIPLVYGDWTEDVPTSGAVEAVCTNGNESGATSYVFKISDAPLQTIDTIWLHRGDRIEGSPEGPIEIDPSLVTKDLDNGEFSIPSDITILDEVFFLVKKAKAGASSTLNVITSDSNLNFVAAGVKPGDTIVNNSPATSTKVIQDITYRAKASGEVGNSVSISYTTGGTAGSEVVTVTGNAINVQIQTGVSTANQVRTAVNGSAAAAAIVRATVTGTGTTPQAAPVSASYLVGGQDGAVQATVTTVSNFSIALSGDITFHDGDEYTIGTVQYTFLKGDKISVTCLGKKLNRLAITRLSDVSTAITAPKAISVGFDSTYWIADDTTQKVYNISFANTILKQIAYTDIDPAITKISGLSAASDSKLWVVDPILSKIFRYDHITDGLGLSFTTASVTSMPASLANVTGIVAKSDNRIWIVDQATATFYEIDAFASTNPFVVTTFSRAAFDASATNTLDVGYDEQNNQVVAVDRATNKFYRLNETTGAPVSSFSLTDIADNVTNASGVCMAQDGTIFLVDEGTLTIYNYTDLSYAYYNPCFIARDLIQKYGGHNYSNFDLSWNQTGAQLSTYKSRAVINAKSNIITYINGLLRQYNVVFHLRFGKYSLFWITFDNFRTNGKLVKEKDIVENTFKPSKEINQYFNSVTASYDKRTFQDTSFQSDTYVSTAAVSFAGREVNRKLELPNVYKRTDLDNLMPLFVRLSAPEPEFVDVTFGFRVIRSQMHDFFNLTFDGDVNPATGLKDSGRRFDSVPCMIRKISYDLGPMTVAMKLWSLGTTRFGSYVPSGSTVGGASDKILLTNLGRLGYIGPTGTITASATSTVTLATVSGINAETRTASSVGLAWKAGYKVDIVDGATKAVAATMTIESVSGSVITFTTPVGITVSNTVKNAAGFVTSGHYLQHTTYDNLTEEQRGLFASFSKPSSNYATSRTQELEEQRGGAHNFADGGIPYVLYPAAFTPL